MPTAPFMWLDDRVVPYAEAKVHAFAGVVKYGCGVFEGLRGYWDEGRGELFVFRLPEHLERLRFGMKVMRYDRIYEQDFLAGVLLETLRANELRGDAHIRMIAYLGGDDMLDQRGPVGLIIGAVPRPSLGLAKGIHVQVASWRRIADSALPPRVMCTGNYVNNRAAEIGAKQDG
jgi:branched-chain amino acid aminotransferase